MTFETNIYKIYETPESQIYRSFNQGPPLNNNVARTIPNPLVLDAECPKCKNTIKIQINFEREFPLVSGAQPYPKNNRLKCPRCGVETELLNLRQQLEAQTGKKIVISD